MNRSELVNMPARMERVWDKLNFRESVGAMSQRRSEVTANIEDIWQTMKTGDGLWYRGTSLFGLLIRCASWSNVSHGGKVRVVDADPHQADDIRGVHCMDVIESFAWKKGGGRSLPLVDAVKAAPGRWYWGPISDTYGLPHDGNPPLYDRIRADEAMQKLLGSTYGWRGIGLRACTYLPVIRELAYALGHNAINTEWENHPPYCSMAQTIIDTYAGVDPVPERAKQLTVPADTFSSLLYGPKITLYSKEASDEDRL